MFGFYTSSDIEDLGSTVSAALDQSNTPLSVQILVVVSALTARARKFNWDNEKPASRYDVVSTVETLAGVIDHNDSKIQCRGETPVHRMRDEATDDIRVLLDAIKAAGVKVPYDRLKTVWED